MAHTCSDVITRAFRKLGVLRAGGIPSSADAAEGLASLQSFYQERITVGSFGRVVAIPLGVGGTHTAGTNQHINVTTEDEVTIDLPATVPADYWCSWDASRDYGWGLNVPGSSGVAMPRDKSVVRVTDQFGEARATYIYDGTIQRWLRIDALLMTNEAPLSARGFEGLAAVLATRLADDFGAELLSPTTVRAANSYLTALVMNYGNADNEMRTGSGAATTGPGPIPAPFNFSDYFESLITD